MNGAENPIADLHDALAHAEYQGFSEIVYESRDIEAIRTAKGTAERTEALNRTVTKTRRPTQRDFSIYAMFTQTWGSTALGHGGMGGASVTTAYTIVLECYHTQEMLVYFGGQYCYTVNRKSKNFDKFVEDCSYRMIVSKKDMEKYS